MPVLDAVRKGGGRDEERLPDLGTLDRVAQPVPEASAVFRQGVRKRLLVVRSARGGQVPAPGQEFLDRQQRRSEGEEVRGVPVLTKVFYGHAGLCELEKSMNRSQAGSIDVAPASSARPIPAAPVSTEVSAVQFGVPSGSGA